MAIDRYNDGANGNNGGRGGSYPPRRRFSSGDNDDGGMYGRIPPQNIEAEMAVLGAMLLGDRGAIEKATEVLERADFYREAHAHIYESMVTLTEKDEPVDIVTLKDELSRRGNLDTLGGVPYLMALADYVPTAANVVYYANIVAEKAVLRRLIEASGQIAGMAYGEVDEVSALVDHAERTIFEVARRRTNQAFTPLRPLLNEAFEKIDTLYHERGITTGVDTGFTDLNYITSGLQDGELIILAARPSMGKTSLAMGIGQNAALRAGKNVAVFSMEMSKESLVQRMICSEARVDAHRLRTGYLQDDDWTRLAEAVQRLWDANLYIDDSNDMNPLEMRAKCRRLRAEQGGLDLVIVDYLQLMSGSKKQSENRNVEITEIARGLKGLARELRAPVVALSQLSRAVEKREDKRPMLSDLRESGAIEAEADIVAFIYRPAYYERKEAVSEAMDEKEDQERRPGEYEGEEAEIIIAKQRNGPTGTVKLSFLPKYARFDNLAEYREESPF